jgi:hypothetical protein
MEVGQGPNVGCSAKGKKKYVYLRGVSSSYFQYVFNTDGFLLSRFGGSCIEHSLDILLSYIEVFSAGFQLKLMFPGFMFNPFFFLVDVARFLVSC